MIIIYYYKCLRCHCCCWCCCKALRYCWFLSIRFFVACWEIYLLPSHAMQVLVTLSTHSTYTFIWVVAARRPLAQWSARSYISQQRHRVVATCVFSLIVSDYTVVRYPLSDRKFFVIQPLFSPTQDWNRSLENLGHQNNDSQICKYIRPVDQKIAYLGSFVQKRAQKSYREKWI